MEFEMSHIYILLYQCNIFISSKPNIILLYTHIHYKHKLFLQYFQNDAYNPNVRS